MSALIDALHRSGCAPAAEGHEHNDCEWLKGFAAGRHVERERVRSFADGLHFAGELKCEKQVRTWLDRLAAEALDV